MLNICKISNAIKNFRAKILMNREMGQLWLHYPEVSSKSEMEWCWAVLSCHGIDSIIQWDISLSDAIVQRTLKNI